MFAVLFGSIAGVVVFTIGYRVGLWKASLYSPKETAAVPEPAERVPDRSVYDVVYTPEQRERNRKQLELMDEFSRLQLKRNDLIRRAGDVGYEILDGPDMVNLKLETIAVLEQLIEYEPEGFYRDLYDDLIAEFGRSDDELQ